jgi:Tfp pilus assembly protein PilZ
MNRTPEHKEPNRKERRLSRTEVGNMNLSVELGGKNSEIVSLGFGGLYIKTQSPFSVGTFFDLILPLPDEEPPILAHAKVVYTDPGAGMGIEFLNLKVRDAERIGVFLLLHT